ncbi:MAG: GGDEF domain-containing protein [Carnobacterium sp.]|uniref:GGDEF domain-containing protein n=1 Tax=Carnobacterium sp. TaxID=48221 RepID=UPI003C782849
MNEGPGDIVSRNGGEEFTILLHNYNAQEVYERVEALRKVVESSFFVINNGSLSINITISIGIAVYKGTTKKIDNLYAHADKALYAAKKSSRNKVCCYSYLLSDSF